ncbi:MAG: ZIP family metal transporter [Bacteroidales bacterium]
MLGGLFALRFQDKLRLILGFSAGAVIGVVFFDLLPEAMELGSKKYSFGTLTSTVTLGFIIYMILDRLSILHIHSHAGHSERRANLGAGSLSIHSFLDGIGIGLAFQISKSIGLIIAVAVMVHDFSDGLNTVNMVLKNEGKARNAFRWLIVDATTPFIGVLVTFLFKLPQSLFGLVLSLFAGFFLYIGASDLLPESQHRYPKLWTTFMTVLGIAVLYLAIRIAKM